MDGCDHSESPNNFKEFYNSSKGSDIDIIVGDTIFKAHKVILCSQNSVFAQRYAKEFFVDNCSSINISKIDANIFKVFLRFLYTREIKSEDISKDVLLLANEYLDENLKRICELHFAKVVNKDNAIELLILAAKYNCLEMKQAASTFIVEHYKEMKLREDFCLIYEEKEATNAILDSFDQKVHTNTEICNRRACTDLYGILGAIPITFYLQFKSLKALERKCYDFSSDINIGIECLPKWRIFGRKLQDSSGEYYLGIGIENPFKNTEYFCEILGEITTSYAYTNAHNSYISGNEKKPFKIQFTSDEDEFVYDKLILWSHVLGQFNKDNCIKVIVYIYLQKYGKHENLQLKPATN